MKRPPFQTLRCLIRMYTELPFQSWLICQRVSHQLRVLMPQRQTNTPDIIKQPYEHCGRSGSHIHLCNLPTATQVIMCQKLVLVEILSCEFKTLIMFVFKDTVGMDRTVSVSAHPVWRSSYHESLILADWFLASGSVEWQVRLLKDAVKHIWVKCKHQQHLQYNLKMLQHLLLVNAGKADRKQVG